MTRQSRIVLNRLLKTVHNEDTVIEISTKPNLFEIDLDPSNTVSFEPYGNEIVSLVQHLNDEGYVQVTDKEGTVFQITHKGFHHRQLAIRFIVEKILTSFITPIAVSFITTLITLYIQRL